jgi:RND superfamily putative drug exporter
MSPLLYALGRFAFRRRGVVVLAWLAVLVVAGSGALLLSLGTSNQFSVPGTQSQEALDTLNQVFPQVSGASGQVLAVATTGHRVTDPAVKSRIEAVAEQLSRDRYVASAQTPWNTSIPVKGGYVPEITATGSAAIINLQMTLPTARMTPVITGAVTRIATAGSDEAVTFHAGGSMFQPATPGVEPTEIIGILVAVGVMALTFGSLRSAAIPLMGALFGVGVSISLILTVTRWVIVSATAPLLAVMIGLAVGIDYSLFILSRHRQQLADGVVPEESTGRAIATSGSAVLFAGMTVMIALVGLSVTGIPFLTIMGLCAAAAVLVAVVVALTLLPAIFGFMGSRLVPRAREKKDGDRPAARPARTRQSGRLAGGWVATVTRVPLLTVVVVVAGLGGLSTLAIGLRLALPDNSTAPAGTPPRVTYDLVSKEFGVGYNVPLIVTASIIQSNNPLALISDVAADLRRVPGVAGVPLATPNQDADTMVVEVIPEGGASDQSTLHLVSTLRSMEKYFHDRYGIDIAVTGQTALEIDVSSLLGKALVPFGVLVIGMSLVLLATVFRSIAVPIKATAGYLLSVGAAFGVTTEIYQRGFLRGPLHTVAVGPIISFVPIILMGVLFGLAMDYEVFLVSRMREDYVHGREAKRAVRTGFVGSSRVVTAAAVIMCVVFGGFVPQGDSNLQPIAMSLAVGVFIDAFMVRMTLVPAVMALLGERAWWFPKWLDRVLPVLDVEGEGVHRQLELADWPRPDAPDGVYIEDLALIDRDETLYDRVDLALDPGEILLVEGGPSSVRTALLLTIAARMRPTRGNLKVAGLVLPEQAVVARSRIAFVRVAETPDVTAAVERELRHRTRVLVLDGLELVPSGETRQDLVDSIEGLCHDRELAAVISTSSEAADVLHLPEVAQSLDLTVPGFPSYLDRDPGPQSAISRESI